MLKSPGATCTTNEAITTKLTQRETQQEFAFVFTQYALTMEEFHILPETVDSSETMSNVIEELCTSLNKATVCLITDEQNVGFERMISVLKTLATCLHFVAGTKDPVCASTDELQVAAAHFQPISMEHAQSLRVPGFFPCAFFVTSIPQSANAENLLSSLSAAAAFNMGIACQR